MGHGNEGTLHAVAIAILAMMRYNYGYRNLKLLGGMLKVPLDMISSDRLLHLLVVKKCSSKVEVGAEVRSMSFKVFLIGKYASTLSSLRSSLEKKGYLVSAVHSRKKALEQVGADKPDLIILDATSPKLDGGKTCQALRQKVGEVPIILSIGKIMTLARLRLIFTWPRLLLSEDWSTALKGLYRAVNKVGRLFRWVA